MTTPEGIIGYAVAEWPWNTTIPSDPKGHPLYPHYQVDWHAHDPQGNDLLTITADTPYFIARALRDRAARQG